MGGNVELAQTYDIDIKINVDDSDLQDTANSLKDLEGSAEEAGNALQESFTEATNRVEELEQALEEAQANGSDWEDMSQLESDLASAQQAADELAEALRNAGDAAGDMGDKTEEGADKVSNSTSNAASSISDLASAAAGVGSAMGLMTMVDTAGRIESSWDRLGITFGGVSAGLRSSVDSAAAATGRSGSSIREYFNMMGIAGIKNTDLLNQSFQALSGKAFQTGADVGQLSSLMQKMALSGNAGARQLTMLGLSTEQLGAVMGVTGEEASKAFKELSQEERLSVLTKAMGDGAAANEAYKNSWEGVKERATNAMAGLMGAVGSAILPVVIPAMDALRGAVETVKGVFTSLPGPVQGVIGAIGAGAMGFVALAGAVGIIMPIITGLLTSFTTLVTIMQAVAAADTLAAGAKAVLNILLGEEAAANFLSASAWLAAAAGEAAALWPILAIIGAVALLVAGFEQLGEWLGWWDSFSGMIDAAKSAITRLWDAFVNSRAVQAAISAVQWYIDTVKHNLEILWGFIQPIVSAIWDAFASLFGEEGSSPDAVQGIIDAFTFLEDVVIGVFDAIQFVVAQVINIFLPIISGITMISQIVQGMFTGQIGILDGIMMIGQTLLNMYMGFWQNIGNIFMQGLQYLLNMVITSVQSIWNGFLDLLARVAQLPALIKGHLTLIVVGVIGWAAKMVSNAKTAATNFVNNIVNGISSLPGKFASKLGEVFDKLADWGRRMVQKAQNIAGDVLNALADAVNPLTGFDEGFDTGISYGFDSGNTLNRSLSSSASTSKSSVTNNFSINGIIEEEAADFIVSKVNEHVQRQNLIRGV